MYSVAPVTQPRSDPDAVRAFRRYAAIIAWVTAILSSVTLMGWVLGFDQLASLALGVAPMRGITAVTFLIVAAILLLILSEARWARPLCQIGALLMIGLGSANFAEHLGLVDFGFSNWQLMVDRQPMTARMSVMTSVVLTLFGFRSLAFLRWKNPLVGDVLSIALLATSMIAMAALGVTVAHGDKSVLLRSTPLAAVLLFSTSLAWIAIEPTTRLGRVVVARGIGGMIARRLMLPALLLPVLYAWVAQWARSVLGIEEAALISISAFITGASVAMLVWYAAALSERVDLQRAKVRALYDAAHTDALTNLANRRSFDEILARLLHERHQVDRHFYLLMLDLDHFKPYNDSFGHPAGDEVLRRTGVLLSSRIRPQDIAARYGGEEFAVLLGDCSMDAAVQTAERIRAAFLDENWPHRAVTVSIGVAQATGEDTAEALIQRADSALYLAKERGRNCVVSAEQPRPSSG